MRAGLTKQRRPGLTAGGTRRHVLACDCCYCMDIKPLVIGDEAAEPNSGHFPLRDGFNSGLNGGVRYWSIYQDLLCATYPSYVLATCSLAAVSTYLVVIAGIYKNGIRHASLPIKPGAPGYC
ncbi:hypothetical protein V8C44DRAFT_297442 [Trichoderma aethiopicum]